VRGQYVGYRDEPGVRPDSETETFVALKCYIDNWRWAGVPFYLRTGKRMAEGARIISIAFKEPPRSMFPAGSGVGDHGPDHLTFDLSDQPRMSLSFYGKRPGPGIEARQAVDAIRHEGHQLGRVRCWRPTSGSSMTLPAATARLFTSAEWHRAPLGDQPAPAGQPSGRAALRPRLLGPQPDPPAGLALRLAAALRAQVARAELTGPASRT
jgi:hypothetical protein